MKSHSLAFDLSFSSVLGHFIPKGFIVENEKDGLGYVLKNANHKTLDSYGIILSDDAKELLNYCKTLSTPKLKQRYNSNTRKEQPLDILLKNPVIKKAVNQYIESFLNKFLGLIKKTDYPFSVNFEKKQPFVHHQVIFSDNAFVPKLYFRKLENHLEYKLSLLASKEEFKPHEEKIQILLDDPPYIIFNRKIYTLKNINANKLKPFLSKEVINIPKRTSVEYFNKFIKKVIKKAPIQAEGFEVKTYNKCLSCVIKPTTTIFSKVYYLEVFFKYKNHSFSIVDNNQKLINFEHNGIDEFTVFETVRNPEEEQKFIADLKSAGIKFLDSGLGTFYTDLSSLDIYENIAQLITLKKKLLTKSLYIDLQMHRFNINGNISTVSTNYYEKNDWFDVEIMVKVGTFKFPFTALVSHLKSGERLYELPDGSYFLIPKEWFSRYKSIAELGKLENQKLLIQKNQFTVLQDAGITTEKDIHKDIIPYQSTGFLKAELREYQKTGVNWLLKNHQLGLGSCLADDMGLGKTLQTLANLDFVYTCFESEFLTQESAVPLDLFSSLNNNSKILKALIVSPSSLTFNWQNETQKFCPHFSTLSYVGQNRKTIKSKVPQVDIVFTSYGTLLKDINFLKNLSFNFIIIDESQQIKNRNSKIYKAINQISATHKVSLSGTPIENSLSDLWSQMQFINPDLLGSFNFFKEHFKKPIEKDNDENKVHELKLLINPFLLRRTKAEVAKDLPEISEQIFYTELDANQAKHYEKIKSEVRNFILDKMQSAFEDKQQKNKISILNALLKLRQLANHPKLIGEDLNSGKFNDITAYLETLIRSKQKTLIFSSFTSHIKIYTDWCDKNSISYNLLTGQTKVKDREKQVEDFQQNKDQLLFFISLKAGGTGLNLTNASYVLILEPWWNPFSELQAIGRAHRIGQTQKVNVVRFIAQHTIEEKINNLQQSKKNLSDSILEQNITDNVMENIDYILD